MPPLAPATELPGRGGSVFGGWCSTLRSRDAVAGDGNPWCDRTRPEPTPAPARSPSGGRGGAASLSATVASLAPAHRRVHGMQRSDAGPPALALDVPPQRTVETPCLATGRSL